MRGIALLALGVGLLSSAEEPPGSGAKQTLDALQGRWTMVSFEVNGESLPEEQVKTGSLVVEQDLYKPTLGERRASFSIQLDPAPDPKAIDFTFTEGPEKGKAALGIYELTADTYKVCIGMAGKPRPKAFVSKPGSGHVLEVLKREKDEPKKKD